MKAALDRSILSLPGILLLLTLTTAPISSFANEFEIDWWTLDSGGTLSSAQGQWTLAGTFGQWDAADQGAISGVWFLEGGFWAFDTPERTDDLFNDRFEFSPLITRSKAADQ